jgi:hypothetical protein
VIRPGKRGIALSGRGPPMGGVCAPAGISWP